MSNPLATLCWQLAEKHGLSGLTHQNLADLSNQPILDLYRLFPTQGHMVLTMMDEIREKAEPVLSTSQFKQQPVRDKLFEAVMSYLDSLQTYENGVKKLWHDLWFSPDSLCTLKPHFSKITKNILIQAEIDVSGAIGFMRQKAFSGFCLYILKSWLDDPSPEKSKTLAALDKGLKQLEEFNNLAIQFDLSS